MARHHKLMVIGQLVSDPRFTPFDNGGGVAKFGLPIDFSRRKKNPATGEWEGDSFIINVDAFNRDNYKLAEYVMQSLKKGSQVYVEGRLKGNEYTDKNGVKQFRPVLVADVVEFLDRRPDSAGGGDEGMRSARPSAAPAPRRAEPSYSNGGGYNEASPPEENTDDIPF